MAISKECKDIGKLKEDYDTLREKYALPDFKILEEDFDIEKAAEKEREANFILRDVRKAMNEKLSAYLRLFESFTSPSNGPSFVFLLLKSLKEDEILKIKEIYKKLAKIQITALKLDTVYSEKAEAEFIKNSVEEWVGLKGEIYNLICGFEKNFDTSSVNGSKSYLG